MADDVIAARLDHAGLAVADLGAAPRGSATCSGWCPSSR